MSPARKSRWKLWGTIIALLLMSFWGIRIYERFRPHKKLLGPLAGFTLMDLPRSDVDIGALWTQGIGPIRGSSGVLRLQTRSLQMSEISTVENVDASVLAELAQSLSLTASSSAQASRTLKLKGLSIVTVADASRLSPVAGNYYLWEAVQVDQFSITSSQAAKDEARAKIKDVTDADSIEEKTVGSDSVELTAKGSKLYVAYRVVTISQPTLTSLYSTQMPSPSSGLNLGSEYALHFSGRKGETLFTPDCTVTIAVSSYLALDNKTHPTQSAPIKVPCGAPRDETYLVGSISGSVLATIDSLQVKDLKVWPTPDGGAQATGNFAIERRTMQLKTLEDPSASGW